MNPKWEENYQKIVENNRKSSRLIEWTTEQKEEFIKRCELVYGVNTKEIVSALEKNGFEGSPEIRRWVRFAKEFNHK